MQFVELVVVGVVVGDDGELYRLVGRWVVADLL